MMNLRFYSLVLLALTLFARPAAAEKKHKQTLPLPSKTTTGPAIPGSGKAGTTAAKPPADRPVADGQAPKSTALSELLPDNLGTCEQKHSIDSFMQIASNQRATPAKNGGIFFVSDLRESAQLYFSKAVGSWPEQLTFFPDGLKYYSVSPDQKKILLASDTGGDEQYDVLLLDLATKDLKPLLVEKGKRVESITWGSDSSWFAYTSNARNKVDFDLYRYDLSPQAATKTELLAELKGLNTLADASDDGRWLIVNQYRSVTDGEIFLYDLKEKKLVSYALQPETYSAGYQFSGDSKFLYFISDLEKGVRQLYRAEVADAAKRSPLTFGPWEVEGITVDTQRRFLTITKNEDGYSQLEAFSIDRSGQKMKPLPLPRLEKGQTGSAMYALIKNEPALYYAKSSTTLPWDIWKFAKGVDTKWTQSTHTFLRPQCMGKELLVRYPSFDKREIPAYVYLPSDTKGPIPFIVSVHGGPESQSRPSFSKLYQYLLERGYGIFVPNVRGSTGYGREFTLADNYKKRMDSVRDANEGTKWLIANNYTKPGQVATFGGSYGGFMVLRMIQTEPALYAAASESVGITDFVSFLKNTSSYRRVLREVEYGPLSDEEFLKSVSPMTYLKDIHTPLLIFHGSNDPRVPVKETEQLVEALKKRDIPVEAKIFADEGHGNAKLRNIMEQAKTMAYFFEKYIRPREVTGQ